MKTVTLPDKPSELLDLFKTIRGLGSIDPRNQFLGSVIAKLEAALAEKPEGGE